MRQSIRHPQIDPLCVDPDHRDVIRIVDAIRGRKVPTQGIGMVLVYIGDDSRLFFTGQRVCAHDTIDAEPACRGEAAVPVNA
jgi:hypothetical protein